MMDEIERDKLLADLERAEAERDGALRRLEQTRAELTDANAERTKLALENARLRQGRPVDPPDSVRSLADIVVRLQERVERLERRADKHEAHPFSPITGIEVAT